MTILRAPSLWLILGLCYLVHAKNPNASNEEGNIPVDVPGLKGRLPRQVLNQVTDADIAKFREQHPGLAKDAVLELHAVVGLRIEMDRDGDWRSCMAKDTYPAEAIDKETVITVNRQLRRRPSWVTGIPRNRDNPNMICNVYNQVLQNVFFKVEKNPGFFCFPVIGKVFACVSPSQLDLEHYAGWKIDDGGVELDGEKIMEKLVKKKPWMQPSTLLKSPVQTTFMIFAGRWCCGT